MLPKSYKLGFARAVILSERAGLSGRWAVALNASAVVVCRIICDEHTERRSMRIAVARSIAKRSQWFLDREKNRSRERQRRFAL